MDLKWAVQAIDVLVATRGSARKKEAWDRIKSELDGLNRLAKQEAFRLAEHVEMYAAAYMKGTGLKPTECYLECQQMENGLYRYEFKPKEKP